MHSTHRGLLRQVDASRAILEFDGRSSFFHPPSLTLFSIDAPTARLLESTSLASILGEPDARPVDGAHVRAAEAVRARLREAGLGGYESRGDLDHFRASWDAPHPERFLVLNVTDSCNLACTYCIARTQGQRDNGSPMMGFDVAKRAIDLFLQEFPAGNTATHITFFGGEPLLNFRTIQECVSYAEGKLRSAGQRIEFSLTTNGMLLTEGTIDYLFQHNVSLIVSMDGDERAHDLHRRQTNGGGSYHTVVRGLMTALQRHPEIISVRATLTPENADCVAMDEHFHGLGVRDWGFEIAHCGCSDGGRGWNDEAMTALEESYGRYARLVLMRMQEGDMRGTVDIAGRLRRLHGRSRAIIPCLMCRALMLATPSGDFYPCQRAERIPELCFGSSGGGIDTERRRRLRPRPVFEMPACNRCWARYLCGGGCPAVVPSDGGGNGSPDPWICRYRRVVWEWTLWTYLKLQEDPPRLNAVLKGIP